MHMAHMRYGMCRGQKIYVGDVEVRAHISMAIHGID
jgi:hypothetical protein